MRRWLLRLRYSFLVLAALCLWQAAKSGGTESLALLVAGVVLGLIGFYAIAQQHREW